MTISNLQKQILHRRALLLAYVTVGYNILEGIVSILAGLSAGSVALIGFGSDSFVESLSGGIVIWRFSRGNSLSKEEEIKIERKATRLVAYTFFILGAYVLYESIKKLVLHEVPDPSLLGIIIAIISLAVMPILFYNKYRIGKLLNSSSLIADAKETFACMFLSIALLIGLGLNYTIGLWQADPAIGIVIVVFLAKEGFEILNEHEE
ncbi:MAG: cation transporter [Dehalococcoidales bacterium]|nr:cation transporter [Dehalococcoidales bacterium]